MRSGLPENRVAERAGSYEAARQESLRDLQALVCELLLKNERLRIALANLTVTRQEEAPRNDG